MSIGRADVAEAPRHSSGDAAPQPRLDVRDGGTDVVRLGERTRWRDLYHRLLVMRWPSFLGVMTLAYLLGNIVFAFLYLLGDHAIANARSGAFSDAFFFSVQTMATIGYGVMYPQSLYANVLMTLETLLGMITVAVGAGL